MPSFVTRDVLMVGGMPFRPIFLTESWDWHASDSISPQRILCSAIFQHLVTGVYEDTDDELYHSTHFACLALFNDKSKPIDSKMYDVDSAVEVVNRKVFSHIPQAWRDILRWILPRPSIHHCESTVDIFAVKKSSAGTYAKSGIGEYGGRCEIVGVVFIHCCIDHINTSPTPLRQTTHDRTSKLQLLQRQGNSSCTPLVGERSCPGRCRWSTLDLFLYRTTKQDIWSNLDRSDWSSFDPPSTQTQAGDLIEVFGRKSTQLFFTVDGP